MSQTDLWLFVKSRDVPFHHLLHPVVGIFFNCSSGTSKIDFYLSHVVVTTTSSPLTVHLLNRKHRKLLLGQEVCVVVVVGQLVQEGPRLQDEGGQDDLGQIHAWPHLLQQSPDQRLILLGHGLRLCSLAGLKRSKSTMLAKKKKKTKPTNCSVPTLNPTEAANSLVNVKVSLSFHQEFHLYADRLSEWWK